MKKLSCIAPIILIVVSSICSQDSGFKDPDKFLIGDRKLPKVLLIGSWHFDYPGLDAHQVNEVDRINIFSERRQAELKELLDYIAKFKPTKIAVEGGRHSGYIIRRFERWKSGETPLSASEIDQIAIRLLDRFGLDTLYGVDAYPLLLELDDERDTTLPMGYVDEVLDRHYFGGDDEIQQRYKSYYDYRNQYYVNHTLLESFRFINSDKVLDRGFGAYISGGQFDSEYYEGVDALSMFWLNRNLRIFRNIQNIDRDENDRILVLFGSAHVSILRYLFECSPMFDLVDFDNLE